jgi:hypothetical protein
LIAEPTRIKAVFVGIRASRVLALRHVMLDPHQTQALEIVLVQIRLVNQTESARESELPL